MTRCSPCDRFAARARRPTESVSRSRRSIISGRWICRVARRSASRHPAMVSICRCGRLTAGTSRMCHGTKMVATSGACRRRVANRRSSRRSRRTTTTSCTHRPVRVSSRYEHRARSARFSMTKSIRIWSSRISCGFRPPAARRISSRRSRMQGVRISPPTQRASGFTKARMDLSRCAGMAPIAGRISRSPASFSRTPVRMCSRRRRVNCRCRRTAIAFSRWSTIVSSLYRCR